MGLAGGAAAVLQAVRESQRRRYAGISTISISTLSSLVVDINEIVSREGDYKGERDQCRYYINDNYLPYPQHKVNTNLQSEM